MTDLRHAFRRPADRSRLACGHATLYERPDPSAMIIDPIDPRALRSRAPAQLLGLLFTTLDRVFGTDGIAARRE